MPDCESTIGNRYQVVRLLGRGSFAQTLLARDAAADRLVALKALHARTLADWKAFELFEREAATLRSLRHQGVPVVYETFHASWNDSETSFLVMEYVEGESLGQIIAERRHLDPAEVLHLFDEMLGVLDYLHTRIPPVLHRDIKPANVIVRTGGSPVLVDFGTVRSAFRDPDEAGSTVAGTYGYMPYEQLMGQASPTSDLYALAATFLHLITGRAPPEFMGDAGRLEVPDSVPGGRTFGGVLRRMLSPAPSERFQSAREVRVALLSGTADGNPGNGITSRLGVPLAIPPSPTLPIALPTAPRPIVGETAALLRRTAPSMWDLIQASEKRGTRWGPMDVALVSLFSVLTLGIMPAVFYSIASTRKRRLKNFLINGQPAVARVIQMTPETVAFDGKLTRVRYEFEVDGRVVRDSDQIMRSIAERWDIGSPIQVLYTAESEYDSIIISTS